MKLHEINIPHYITNLSIAYIQSALLKEDKDVIGYFEDLIFDWMYEEDVPFSFNELISNIGKEQKLW